MKTIEQIRDAFHLIHRVATGQSDRAYMSIPADPERDADLIVSAAIDELETLRDERDALKAHVEAHAHDLGSLRSAVHDALPLDYPDGLLIKQVSVMGAELVRLRRQVEAARALCRDQLDHGKVEADDLAGRILDAMKYPEGR